MKRRDIEKQLRKEADEHTPELYDTIVRSARSEGLLQDSDQTEIYKQGDAAVLARNKKRYMTGAIALFVAILACIVILLPLLLKRDGNSPFRPNFGTLSANDVYGMGAVSTVKLLGGETSVRAIQRLSSVRNAVSDSADTESDVKAQARKFNEYFTALDSFMGEEIVATVSEKNTDERYPYTTKLTINSKGFNGETVQHVMYFTETLVITKEEDEDETESKYTLEGIMVVDGNDYHLEGERTFEQEEGEAENELRIRAYADLSDKTNYVEMEQEHSVEEDETETEYVYSVVANGICVEQTAVEFEAEKEGGKEEVEYELEFRQGDAKGRYVIERETENGTKQIKVEYLIDEKNGAFRIREITSASGKKQYEYTFADQSKLVF